MSGSKTRLRDVVATESDVTAKIEIDFKALLDVLGFLPPGASSFIIRRAKNRLSG